MNRAALGARLGAEPNPQAPPEGIDTEYFQRDGVRVALEWTHTSRRLRSLVLEWAPVGAGSQAI